MQKKYNLPSLTTKTTKEARAKLHTALMEVHGVKKATLSPGTNSFEIEAKPEQKPKRDDIMSAATKAGFEAPAN